MDGNSCTRLPATSRVKSQNDRMIAWACISGDGARGLRLLDGRITGARYRDEILRPEVVPRCLGRSTRNRHVFMDDNAPIHRAGVCLSALQAARITTQSGPPIPLTLTLWRTYGPYCPGELMLDAPLLKRSSAPLL